MAKLKIEVPKNSQQSRVGFMRNIRQKKERTINKKGNLRYKRNGEQDMMAMGKCDVMRAELYVCKDKGARERV